MFVISSWYTASKDSFPISLLTYVWSKTTLIRNVWMGGAGTGSCISKKLDVQKNENILLL